MVIIGHSPSARHGAKGFAFIMSFYSYHRLSRHRMETKAQSLVTCCDLTDEGKQSQDSNAVHQILNLFPKLFCSAPLYEKQHMIVKYTNFGNLLLKKRETTPACRFMPGACTN